MAVKQINPDLTEEQKKVLFDEATEVPFTSKFLHNKDTGMYTCANCGAELFRSESQYDSNTPGLEGWPSFSEIAKNDAVKLIPDNTLGMERIKVICSNCGAHLGHVFPEASSPTGQHYCINGAALGFDTPTKN